jgi:hypothetical protein
MKNNVVTIAIAGLLVEVGRLAEIGEAFESIVVIESEPLPSRGLS